jgi:hypothetical protein
MIAYAKGTALRLLVALAAAALAACSSGGDGVAREEQTPATYLFYEDSDGRAAVDPRDASTIHLASDVHGAALLTNGTYHEGGAVTRAHTQALVLWQGDDLDNLTLHRVDGVVGASAPTPVRVSSAVVPDGSVCDWGVHPDHANPARSAVHANTFGPDGDCGTVADNGVLLARLSMAETDPAYSASGASLVAPVYGTDGAISGWLLGDASGLYLATATLGSRTLLHAGGYELLAVGASRTWLLAGNGLKYLAPGASALADPGGVATTVAVPNPARAVDETHLYLADGAPGGWIVRVRRDGGSPAAVVETLPAGERVARLLLTRSRILYEEGSSGTFRSIPKAGGAVATVYTPAAAGNVISAYTAGASAYFYDQGREVAAAVAEDGSDLVEHVTTGATYWTFVAGDSYVPGRGESLDRTARWGDWARALLVEDDGSGGGLTLRDFDAATRAPGPMQETLPAGWAYPYALAEGTGTVTLLPTRDPGGAADIFLVDSARPGSLVQLTFTPLHSESEVGTMGCASGGAAAGPALLALLAWIGVRGRRAG